MHCATLHLLDDALLVLTKSYQHLAFVRGGGLRQYSTLLTGFVGHGAPTMWSFQGMVTPDDLTDLHNEGKPTMIGTMTCYTSYFVSPAGDSVAHRWMNGYRENAAGNRIPGVANGAAAIHGAATLSDYGANETFMQAVLLHHSSNFHMLIAIHRIDNTRT